MRDLIVFGEDFGGLPSSTQHLIKGLSKQRTILWVNSIGLRKPKWNFGDAKRALRKVLGGANQDFASNDAVPSNVKVVNVRTIPAPQHAWERRLAQQMICAQLTPHINRLKLDNPILWSSLPTAADVCGHLGESSVVYYCGDDFNALAGVDHQTISQHESLLTNKASLILAASCNLQNKFPACKTTLLRHGVDFERFATPAPRAADLPTGKPIAGFYGSLSQWLDYKLLNQLIESLPEWDFVFIGKNELPRSGFKAHPNLHLLGPRAHHQLPSYVQHWDVSLLPFVDNQQIRACSPLKLMEYIATGKPILHTPFPAAEAFSHQLNQAVGSMQWRSKLQNIEQLTLPDPSSVASDSWSSRAQFVDWLLELL